MTDTYSGIWVYAEQRNGKLLDSGPELLGEARKIADKRGQELAAVVLGSNIAGLADELAAYGADKVYVADAPILENYLCEAYAPVLEDMIKQYKPEVFVIGGSNIGMDLAPSVAAKVTTGVAAHAVGLDVDDNGCLKAFVPSFGGSIMASITCATHRPQMATIPPGFLKKPEKQEGKKAEVVKVEVKVNPNELRTKVLEVKTETSATKPLEAAETVVAGGYGIGSKENWKILDDLAEVLNASVGATRPACDEGWAVQDTQMIGQSGKTVHPELYIGVGISGVIHHLIGIQDSKKIVAINRDAEAPIMKAADYAIVADYKDVVPALIEEFKKLKV
ncbi:MAG: electron transfer flavoprotein subunit alpha/FixB family protein [Dehalococcoidales bacterium]|nr:electron transfer flavoprotein subunit alpha/FixB family protein [Dehalococcoidales bacterium]